MLICFAGPKGSGKDTAAHPLLEIGFQRINLADELKRLCAEVFGFSLYRMESLEAKERLFDKPLAISEEHLCGLVSLGGAAEGYTSDDGLYDEIEKAMADAYLGLEVRSLRELLQWIGAAFREQVDPEFWINIWRDKVLDARAASPHRHRGIYTSRPTGVVCTDIRYANERQAAREIGGVLVYIDRPAPVRTDPHPSENDFGEPSDYHAILDNDGSIDHLQRRAAVTAMTGGAYLLDFDGTDGRDALRRYFTGTNRIY